MNQRIGYARVSTDDQPLDLQRDALTCSCAATNEGVCSETEVTSKNRLSTRRMSKEANPIAVIAAEVPVRAKPSVYPEPFASRMMSREKRPLGDLFGLTNFGVNLTRLPPNAVSALRHAHTKQDEFIYILQGRPTLHTDEGRTQLFPGMCAGFKAATGDGHRLVNETAEDVVYLEVGDRTSGDEANYPDDDLKATFVEGKWMFVHKDGTPYV